MRRMIPHRLRVLIPRAQPLTRNHRNKRNLKASLESSRVVVLWTFEALRQHGYKGGLSVLSVPTPRDDIKPDWTWSTGKERRETTDVGESYQERQKTREALRDGEALMNVQTSKEKKNMSFQQKEKRKRELGQASRGKSYVEEEKRLLRESGVYSGFDT
ncbi:hypothetical protein OIU76_001589 [Salix suchowensis]|nr:hypothetical protein OIU76_001589 [Salix suchowensis]